MLDHFRDLNARLDRASLRVRRPHQIVFLCGGLISTDSGEKAVLSVRDYLYRVRKAENAVGARLVLAETAQQLYRDTTYNDLISFEEDIAKVSSIVLVISESPGSLAELGSFSSELAIRDTVRIILSEDHNGAESFVRFGPIKRIEDRSRANVGVFPWSVHKASGHVVKSSIKPHYNEIVAFIKGHVDAVPATLNYSLVPDKAAFFDVLWVLSLFEAVPPEPLYDAVRIIHPTLSDSNIKNLLYALKVCRWVSSFSYSGRDYYYLPINEDPYEYAFRAGMRVRDVAATKLEIATAFRRDAKVTKAITLRLRDKRAGK